MSANYMLLLKESVLTTSTWQDKLPASSASCFETHLRSLHILDSIFSTAFFLSFSTFYHVSVNSLIISASYCWSALLVSSSCLLSHYVSGARTSVILTGQTGLHLFIEAKTSPLDSWRLAHKFMVKDNFKDIDNSVRTFQF